MYMPSILTLPVILGLLCTGSTGIWPFHSFASANVESSHQRVQQVAVIGAGAAGSSAAYHLKKIGRDAGLAINVTVFEKSGYVGGRSTTVNAFDDPTEPVELGASIFVEVNKILKNAADEFGLSTHSRERTDGEPEILGIWNGDKFVYSQMDGGWEWWDTAKLLWKYGLAPIRTQRLMRSTVGKFLQLYETPFFPFRSLSERAQDLDLIAVTAMTGQQFLNANNIGAPFSTDIIQASTRVNYAQNLGIIHGLETMVCMAIEGAMSIQGGNWQIFHNFINASGADLRLNTTVTELKRNKGKYTVLTTSSHNLSKEDTFDAVVLAAPLQFSDIQLQENIVKRVPDEIPYVRLHVTLLASPLRISRTHFHLKEGAKVPTTILTTLSPDEDPSNRESVVGKSGFFSISTLRSIINPKTLEKEYLYKIFSPEKITEEFLASLLGITLTPSTSIFNTSTSDAISWYHPHIWHSYPYELPRVTFEDLELGKGFYYTSGIESFISTMETSALMGKNVAQLIVDDFLGVVDRMKLQDATAQKPGEEL